MKVDELILKEAKGNGKDHDERGAARLTGNE